MSIIPIPLLVFIILLILLLDSVLIWTLLTTTTALSIKKPQDAIPVIEVFLATLFCLAVCVNLITTQTIARNQEQPIEIVKKVDVTYDPDYPDYIIVFRLTEDKLGRNQLYRAEVKNHLAEQYSEGKTYYKTLYDMFKFSDIKRIITKE